MKPKELKKLISQGESQELDFKKTISSPQKIAKTLVAFANTKGGRLLIGVMDNREISGVDLEEEMFQITEASKHYCQPSVPISFDKAEDNEKLVLIIDVPESANKPHAAFDSHGEWTPYVRMHDKSVIASKATLNSMKSGEPTPNVPLHELSKQEKKLFEYLRKNERITLKEFSKLVNMSDRRAKRILTDLTLSGHLLLHDFEKEDFYSAVD